MSVRISNLGEWLLLPAQERRRSHCPLSDIFEGSEVEVSKLLPYAPEDLQCTVCFRDLLQFVLDQHAHPRTCSKGHLLCSLCWRRLNGDLACCPTCREAGFYPVPLLTRLAQHSFELCPFGCGQLVRGNQREKHLIVECNHRPFVCPICEADCKTKDFVNHCHQNPTHFSNSFAISFRDLRPIQSQTSFWLHEVHLRKTSDQTLIALTKFTLHHLQEEVQSTQLLLSLELVFCTDECHTRGSEILGGVVTVTSLDDEGRKFVSTRPIHLRAWEPKWCELIIPPFGDLSGCLEIDFLFDKDLDSVQETGF